MCSVTGWFGGHITGRGDALFAEAPAPRADAIMGVSRDALSGVFPYMYVLYVHIFQVCFLICMSYMYVLYVHIFEVCFLTCMYISGVFPYIMSDMYVLYVCRVCVRLVYVLCIHRRAWFCLYSTSTTVLNFFSFFCLYCACTILPVLHLYQGADFFVMILFFFFLLFFFIQRADRDQSGSIDVNEFEEAFDEILGKLEVEIIYKYMRVCVCVCVCVWIWRGLWRNSGQAGGKISEQLCENSFFLDSTFQNFLGTKRVLVHSACLWHM